MTHNAMPAWFFFPKCLGKREIVWLRLLCGPEEIRPVKQLRVDRVHRHETLDPDVATRLRNLLLQLFGRDLDKNAPLHFKRLASLLGRDHFFRTRIDHMLLHARAVTPVQQVKVNLAIDDRGIELHRDFVLLYQEVSLPHGSGRQRTLPR